MVKVKSNANTATTPAKTGFSFVKKGKEAFKEQEKYEATVEAKKAAMGKAKSFWMREGDDAKIIFLDGAWNVDDGMLELNQFYLHEYVHFPAGLNGRKDFICVEGHDPKEPCPLCAADANKSFVGVFTVLDLTPYKKKDGTVNQGERKLYIAKSRVLKTLSQIGQKRQGLVGIEFDVMRPTDKDARTGSQFDFQQKWDFEKLATKFGKEMTEPFDYDKEMDYYTAKELRDLGVGLGVTSSFVGDEPASSDLESEM